LEGRSLIMIVAPKKDIKPRADDLVAEEAEGAEGAGPQQ
jgi:hypothetical protein